MGRKPLIDSHKMIDAQSMGASITSGETSTKSLDQGSILVEWSAGSTPVGTITVEAKHGDNGSWYELDFGQTISISGNSGNHEIVFNSFPFSHLRIKYTRSSGSGTLSCTISAKAVGA